MFFTCLLLRGYLSPRIFFSIASYTRLALRFLRSGEPVFRACIGSILASASLFCVAMALEATKLTPRAAMLLHVTFFTNFRGVPLAFTIPLTFTIVMTAEAIVMSDTFRNEYAGTERWMLS